MTVLRADGELEASASYDSKKKMAKRAIVSAEKTGRTMYLFREDGTWNYTQDQESACKRADRSLGDGPNEYIGTVSPDDSPHYRALWSLGLDGEALRDSIDAEKFNWDK